MPRMNLQSY